MRREAVLRPGPGTAHPDSTSMGHIGRHQLRNAGVAQSHRGTRLGRLAVATKVLCACAPLALHGAMATSPERGGSGDSNLASQDSLGEAVVAQPKPERSTTDSEGAVETQQPLDEVGAGVEEDENPFDVTGRGSVEGDEKIAGSKDHEREESAHSLSRAQQLLLDPRQLQHFIDSRGVPFARQALAQAFEHPAIAELINSQKESLRFELKQKFSALTSEDEGPQASAIEVSDGDLDSRRHKRHQSGRIESTGELMMSAFFKGLELVRGSDQLRQAIKNAQERRELLDRLPDCTDAKGLSEEEIELLIKQQQRYEKPFAGYQFDPREHKHGQWPDLTKPQCRQQHERFMMAISTRVKSPA